ncbi:MAG TPA: hypothetical protein DDY98_04415, partial [Ruminococcaceae bacterium]|nr:hypothetical protein [Oscillospiraceae bacterium]
MDLNGKTISEIGPFPEYSFLLQNKGTLTVMDSTDTDADGKNCGKLTACAANPDPQGNPVYGNYTIDNYGVLTVNSGFIENTTTGGYATYGINNMDDGKVEINGGRIYQITTEAIRMGCNGGSTAENKVVINGGSVESGAEGYRAIWIQYFSEQVAQKATLLIHGGCVVGAVNCSNGQNAITNIQAQNLTITVDSVDAEIVNSLQILQSVAQTANITVSMGRLGNFSDLANSKYITGGYYNADVSSFLKDGYYLIPNPDTSVQGKSGMVDVSGYKYKVGTEASSAYGAKVVHSDKSETFYLTATSAADAAVSGETVVLLKDNEGKVLCDVGKTLTVDLN